MRWMWNVIWLAACGEASAPSRNEPALVPLPQRIDQTEGTLPLTDATTLAAEGPEALRVAEALAAAWRPPTGLPLPVVEETTGTITLRISTAASLPPEGYTLDIDAEGVRVVAADAAGLFWATQTLRQLLPATTLGTSTVSGPWNLPFVSISDAPRYPWRGYMLDVARHFFTVAEVKRQIDVLALHKLNRLHLHLTDDQGWRIEIESWPDLTLVGGATEVDGGPGGYYTQADYAEIVAYASARFITVVPEIDFPGHAHAALASYPELNADGIAPEPYTGRGVISTPLWVEGEVTFPFVTDVWREVIALTPGEWVHLGGDEAIDVDPAAYAAFMTDLAAFVQEQGKTPIGWDEIGNAPMEPPFIAQHWLEADLARASVERGGSLIASPAEHAYLDMVHDEAAEYGQWWAGPVNVEAAYRWNPAPPGVEPASVLGVEGALWTELVADEEQVDFMTWPRLAALAEVGWSDAGSLDWDDFRARLEIHGERLDRLGVGYYQTPEIDW